MSDSDGPAEAEAVEQAVMAAELLFSSGVEMVFLSTEGGQLLLSEAIPNRRVILVARSAEEVRRYAAEFFRRSKA